MSKLLVEQCLEISVFKLKEWGYLRKGECKFGGIKWTSSYGKENRVNFWINLTEENDMYLELDYKSRNHGEEYQKIKYKIPITTTKCFYGGERYWFVCSMYSNGCYCGRRIAKLYCGGGTHYFACRYCLDLTYHSRVSGVAYTDDELDELGMSIKRWEYNGKPTRKSRRYEKMSKSIDKNWAYVIKRFKL